MKKFQKFLALVLVLALAVTVFAGCSGGSGSGSAAGGSGSGSGDLPDVDNSQAVNLTMYFISDKPGKWDEVEANYNKLFQEKLNTTLTTQWIAWSDYGNKYPLLFSSGEEFDLAYTATWLSYASLAQKGAFKELDDIWPKYAPNNWAQQSEAAKIQATVNGHYYCIPTLLATYSAYGPYYRTDLLDDSEWDGAMEGFDDLETYLDAIKAKYPEMQPYGVTMSGSELDDMWLGANSLYAIRGTSWLFIDPFADEPKLTTWYQYDGVMDFLTMMKRWCEKGFWSRSALSNAGNNEMDNGIFCVDVHNVDTYSGKVINEYNDPKGWTWGYKNWVKDVSNLPFTQDACVIPTTTKHADRALQLYDYITTDEEGYRAFMNGIEGTTYEIVDGQVRTLNADQDYGSTGMWAARNSKFNLPTEGSPEDEQEMKAEWDAYIAENGNRHSQYYSGFTIDTTSIETEYNACGNVVQQYWWPLELGFTDDLEAGLKEFQSQMEAAGVNKVIETLQAQLEDYIKNFPPES